MNSPRTERFHREINVKGDESASSSHFSRNILHLSKYYWPVIVPHILFEQFFRVSNIWFLITSIFQIAIDDDSPVGRYTTVAPLIFMLLVAIIKSSYADFKLKKQDQKINSSKYQVWNGEEFKEKRCDDIIVGDLVMVDKDQIVPADLVILYFEGNKKNAFIDMSSLSGSSSLKEVKVIEKNTKIVNENSGTITVNLKFKGTFYITEPSSDYNNFDGKIVISGIPGSVEVNISNLAFRGSCLKCVDKSVGLAVYCGNESKIQLNGTETRKKSSQIEKRINVFIIQILIAFSLVIGISLIPYYEVYVNKNIRSSDKFNQEYFEFSSQPNPIRPIITFSLLYSYIIPISLFVSIDLARWIQSHNLKRLLPGTMILNDKINEDLGQVEYILADKTGTITEKSLSVVNLVVHDKHLSEKLRNSISYENNNLLIPESFMIEDPHKLDMFKEAIFDSSKYKKAKHFIRCMCLSNSLIKDQNQFIGSYDEQALVEVARYIGFDLLDSNSSHITMNINGKEKNFDCIIVKPFDSEVKKSRAIVINHEEKSGYFYIKGERSKLIDSLKCSRQLKININNQIFDMNNKGYRTMILAYKKLSRDVIEKTRKKLKKINQILLNSEENIEKMFKKLEDDFTFLGVSCIEEKIRPETIDTVNSIRKAGIKIWMVSGDTYSNTVLAFKKSEMIPENSEIIHIRSIKDDYQCQKILKESISEYIFKERKKKRTMSSILDFSSFRLDVGAELSEENTKKLNNQALFSKIADVQLDEINLDREFDVRHLKYVVSIDGDSLITALNNDNCRKLLLLLLVCAKSVCFSALTPIDKGKVVKLLKKNLKFKPIVMSVGRGEGNISLLRESDIGVSLFTNLENNSLLQHNSDVIISHFSQLEKLVLKHGHWFYFRICRMILLYFYKNFFLILLLLGFFFECEYSGTSLFNSSLLVGFNIFFTTSCMLHIGIYDKDLTGREIEENLQVYMIGIIGMHFNLVKFLKYMSFAAVQAAIFLFVFFYFHQEIINEDGKTDDLEMFGTVIFLSMVFTILLQTILETSTYSVAYFLSHGACVSLLIGYVFYASAYDDVSEISLLGVQKKIGNSSLPFFNIFCSSTICVAFTYVVVKFRELFNPGIIQKIKSIHEDGLFYDRIKEYSKSLSSIYRDSLSWSTSSNRHKFAMKKYSKVFKLRFVEKEFKESFIEDQIILIRITVTLMWFLLIAWSFIQKLMSNSNGDYTKTSYILASVFSIFVLLVYTSHFKRHFTLYILAGFTISIVVKFAIEVSFKYYSILASSLVPLLAYILLNVGWFMMNFVNLFNILLTIISVIIVNSGQSHDENYKKYNSPISASLLIVFVAITMIAAIVGYFIELSKRKEFKLLNKTFTVVERTQSILSLLLPQFVKHRVNDGARFIAEAEEDVTIMFCDIYKFDEICQEIKPKDVCECLDKLFQIFDGLCENIGVTKIETVGKTYMACSGIKESEQEISHYLSAVPPARRVVELALAIIREVKNTRLPNDKKLRVKIGIHTGRVVAGVVGYHKPQFSLVGDTVNTASRMCSTLDKLNRVQISGVTYAKLSEFSEYNFEYREIEAKGKGKLPAYIVTYKNYESSMPRSQSFELPLIRELKTPQKPAKVSSVKHQLEEILNRISSKRINPISFITCKESNEKTQMPIRTLKPSKKIIKGTLLIAIVTYCLITVNIGVYLKVNEGKETNNFEYYLGVKFVVIVSFSMILYFFDRLLPTRCYPVLIAVISLASMLINFVPFMQEGTNDDMILIIANYIGIEFMFCSIILSHTSGLQFQYVFFLNSFFFIPWTYLIFTSDEKGYHISNIAITACFVVINCVAIIIREKIYLVNIFLKKRANAEIKKTKKLLSQMMPPTALSRLQNNLAYTERINDVTILFADIVGFTNWSANRKSEEIIKMLFRLFKRFDKKCIFHDIYKVCTIGDCYVVLGYAGKQERDPWMECMNVIEMGKSMIKIIHKQNQIHGSELNMRIGIHTGDITGGIIGSGVVRYDIWGTDVLLANKLESSGLSGKIHVSETTKLMIDELFGDSSQVMVDKYPNDWIEKYLEIKILENQQFIENYINSKKNYDENQRFSDIWQEKAEKVLKKLKKGGKDVEITEDVKERYRENKIKKFSGKIAKQQMRENMLKSRFNKISRNKSSRYHLPTENFQESSSYKFKFDKEIDTFSNEKINTYFLKDHLKDMSFSKSVEKNQNIKPIEKKIKHSLSNKSEIFNNNSNSIEEKSRNKDFSFSSFSKKEELVKPKMKFNKNKANTSMTNSVLENQVSDDSELESS